MTVVLGNGWPGILLHEAIGHGLEGDFNRKGTSAFSGRVGQRVAAPGVTVVDDGTLGERRGSLNLDDEGNPTQRTVLIEDGILRGYMQDRLNAGLMKTGHTGNGRRESFAHLPMPRMTNTIMLAGDHDPAEIIASVKNGLYAANFGGGQVDITSGKFVFSAAEAYMIEDGKVTYPVKGATLIGNGPDALTRVSMVGNDLRARRRRGHVRQGWPERAGRRGAADAADRRPHRRRNVVAAVAYAPGSLVQRPGSRRVRHGRRRRRVMADDRASLTACASARSSRRRRRARLHRRPAGARSHFASRGRPSRARRPGRGGT